MPADVTDGELYDETVRGAVPPDAVMAWEEADGSGARGSSVTELAQSTAFSDLYAAAAGAVNAEDVVFTPAGTIAATDVQAAIEELDATIAGAGYTNEDARDAIGTALVAGEGIDITVSDGSDTITIDGEDASATNKGIVELATDAEAITGTDTVRATTPANVKAAASSGTLTDAASIITATTIESGLQEAFNGSFSVNTNAATGSTETLTLQPAHKMTMDQNCTFTFPTPSTNGHTFQLWLLGSFTPTFPASVDWHGSAAPTYVNDSLYGFTTLDGGTNWLGALIASNLG